MSDPGGYYYTWTDTSEINWTSDNDSIYISLYDYDEDDYETINLLYNVEDDSLYLSMEFNYCDGMEAYYYIDCYEMFGMMLAIDDIQEVTVKLDVVMSVYETGLVDLDPNVNRSKYQVHSAYIKTIQIHSILLLYYNMIYQWVG